MLPVNLQDSIDQTEISSDDGPFIAPGQNDNADCRTTQHSTKSMRSYKNEIILFLYVIVALALNGAIKPFKRGFFCDDMTIRYPVEKDTVKFAELACICLFLPLLCFKICEKRLRELLLAKSRQYSYKLKSKVDLDGRQVVEQKALLQMHQGIKRRSVNNTSSSSQETDDDNNLAHELGHNYANQLYSSQGDAGRVVKIDYAAQIGMYKIYIFGLGTTLWITGMGKVLTGRMRPHFFEKCRPDTDCTSHENRHMYIESFQCTGIVNDSYDYYYITTSWPSGHASMIFYTMIYMIIYINQVVPIITKSSLLKQCRMMSQMVRLSISTLMFAFAGYISMTRITDYHHHTTDVISGIIIGSSIAILWSKALSIV